MASLMPDQPLPSQPQNITDPRMVPNCTLDDRGTYVCELKNLPRVVTWMGVKNPNRYATTPSCSQLIYAQLHTFIK